MTSHRRLRESAFLAMLVMLMISTLPAAGQVGEEAPCIEVHPVRFACLGPLLPPDPKTATIATGVDHTCIVTVSGNVTCWGSDSFGQSADYDGQDAISVSAGAAHSCALLSDGNVVCWGTDYEGTPMESYQGGDAVQLTSGDDHACVLRSGGEIACWGDDRYRQSRPPAMPYMEAIGAEVIQVDAGGVHTCALLSNGIVDCWGNNGQGRAEDYRVGDARTLSAGGRHTCVTTASGGLHCWGLDHRSQAPDRTELDPEVIEEEPWAAVEAAYFEVLRQAGSTGLPERTWTPGGSLGQYGQFVAVSAGENHTCALLESGEVRCSRPDQSLMDPREAGSNVSEARIVALAAGGGHQCVLTTDQQVLCWGTNDHGESAIYGRLPATEVGVGYWHTCLVLTDGNGRCWGNNLQSQPAADYLGQDALRITASAIGTCVLTTAANVACQPIHDGTNVTLIYDGGDALQVDMDNTRICALLESGNVRCWDDLTGTSAWDQVTTGDAVHVSAGYYQTCALLAGGSVDCWGGTGLGQGDDRPGTDAIALVSGGYHNCALLKSGIMDCWGGTAFHADGVRVAGTTLAASTGTVSNSFVGRTYVRESDQTVYSIDRDHPNGLKQVLAEPTVAMDGDLDYPLCAVTIHGETHCAREREIVTRMIYTYGEPPLLPS